VPLFSRIIGAALAAALSAGGLVQAAPPAAAASGPNLPTPALIERATRRGSIDRTRGNLLLAYAFGRPEKLPEAYRSDVPWEGTEPLLELQRAQKAMAPGPARTEIRQILSAETGPGSCGSSGGSLPNSTTTPHFYVEYGSLGGGLSIGSYTASLETSWTTEVDTFGWSAPPVWTPNAPPGNRYHVRVDALGPGLYGYVTNSGAHAGLVGNNPNSGWDDVDSYASCMVLRNDFSGFPSSPQASLDSTAAHEFNHSIQFGYGALHGANRPDLLFIEGGTTWLEDEVFDASNDNYFFLWPVFAQNLGNYHASPYAGWIAFRGLTERYGTGTADGGEQIMQDFWEETSKNTGDNLTALQAALANRGTNLADAYHAYAIAAKFNKACGGGYVYPYCLEEGAGYVAARGATTVHGTIGSVGSSFNGTVEDNYALNWVQLPTGGGTFDATLTNTDASGGMLRGSVVCDTGTGFSIHGFPAVVGAGGSSSIAQIDPTGCVAAVAVITNQSQTAANPGTSVPRGYQLSTSAPSANATLSVVRVGSGAGTVTSNPAGIDCGSDCAESYVDGTMVDLTAAPSAGSTFSGWSGACTGSGSCSVTVDSAKSVAANFTGFFTVSVAKSGSGNGTASSDVAGINCGADCSETYPFGTVVHLTAAASPGSSFTGWNGGGCIGNGACDVTVNSNKSVGVRFTDASAPSPPSLDGSNLSKPFQMSTKIDLSWGVAEIAQYDVRYRSAPVAADFGGFAVWQTGTSGTSAVFNGSPGRAYCFSARATDADLNTSDYGAERCTAIPAGSTALKHRGPWAKKKGSGYFLGAFSVTSTKGATLVLPNVRAKRLAIVVTKCPGCGTIKVFFRSKLLRTIRLGAGSTRKRQIVDLATFNAVQSGKLRAVVTSSGRPVKIEGVGVSAA
jgi:List-Bact-rpt repeat protein